MKKWIILTCFFCGVLSIFVLYFLSYKNKDQDIIKIGAILPLTGDAAQWGIPPNKGALLAIEEINNSGGVAGKQLELICEDSAADPKRGVAAFNKLTSVNNVKMILGPVASNVTLAVAPLAEAKECILISPASTSPKITHAGNFIFRVIASDDLRGKVFADYVFNDEKIKKIAFLYINNEGGEGGKHAFISRFLELGGKVLLEETYSPNTTDIRSQLAKIKSSNVDAVIIVSYPSDTIQIMKQALQLKLNKPLFFQTEAVDDPNVLREAGNSAEGVVYILPAEATGEIPSQFAAAYQRKFKSNPEIFAAEAYDVVYLIASAIKHTDGKISTNEIRKYLLSVNNYQGASGVFSFDNYGDVNKPFAIKKISDNKPKLIRIKSL